MSQPIQPLRINKGSALSSPSKMSGAPIQRPLAELSPMERRRNSPSFGQNNKKQLLDSSPLETSPFQCKFGSSPFASNSPMAYWQNRDPMSARNSVENRDPRGDSPSPTKRSSIENLKRASRVKNSNMFAREQKHEYDPSSALVVDRPLAAGRPLSANVFNSPRSPDHQAQGLPSTKTFSPSPVRSPDTSPKLPEPQKTPSREQLSPAKSSLSKNSRYNVPVDFERALDSENEESFADRQLPPGKSLHRHAKSVTFDAAPPQVNEYEMTTPDPSSVASGSREGSYDSVEDDEEDSFEERPINADDSFDASLEDTDKTPVVLPEDWRFMTPSHSKNPLPGTADPFIAENSEAAGQTEIMAIDPSQVPTRTDSVNSNGERRPLPPLPPPGFPRMRSDSSGSLQAAAERVASAQRNLPTPPRPASISKSELQNMTSGSMPLEDRLRLMMAQQQESSQAAKPVADEQRERRLRRAGASPSRTTQFDQPDPGFHIHEDASETDELKDMEEFKPLKKINRESILRKIKSQGLSAEADRSSSFGSPVGLGPGLIDPDTPIPSLEDRTDLVIAEDGVVIKQEEDSGSEVDVYAIPDMYRQQLASKQTVGVSQSRSSSGNEKLGMTDDDDESHYSTDLNSEQAFVSQDSLEDNGPPTPRPISKQEPLQQTRGDRMSLPQFASMLSEEDFGQSLSVYLTPSPPGDEQAKIEMQPDLTTNPIPSLPRPSTPELQIKQEPFSFEESVEEPSTPDSVIRHSLSAEIEPETPDIPEPIATVKSAGTKLKVRPSLAPADVQTMAETRRKVSGEDQIPRRPLERANKRPSTIAEGDSFLPDDNEIDGEDGHVRRKSSLLQIDIPVDEIDEGLSFGLDKEFDRVIEAQKKGYLMRQNTKMVVASSASDESVPPVDSRAALPRATRSAGNSPVKQNVSGAWTTEPWNGKIRRRSIRHSAGGLAPSHVSNAVPPLPGQSGVIDEFGAMTGGSDLADIDEFEEGGERGRLFVKVVGVKELEMPLPRGERSFFALTLDNGLHCVTTSWLELGKSAPIGQEFELVVLNELEFQLTLQTKLEKPKPTKVVQSPTKPKPVKQSTFSRVFASPKKRKEMELKQQEEAQKAAMQRQMEMQASANVLPSAWDLLHKLVGEDGSFARAYVSLKDHEARSFGRPYTVDVPCFNEWTMEERRTVGSSKSGRAASTMHRKAPYLIGKLELQLLFVPKPKDATDEDMPKSMNACVRELREAEGSARTSWEGHLSQQGGDCPYWRRRFFRLDGSKLTAYHESTRQPRATINLSKAIKLVDDKSTLTQKEVSGKGGSRRKSAFSAEEEGYMFVEEGFRIRFANGEIIDFYADSPADKDGWMLALAQVVGKESKSKKKWTDMVLTREKAASARAAKVQPTNTTSMKSAPGTPAAKHSSPHKSHHPRPSSQQAQRPRSHDKPLPSGGRDPRTMTAEERRQKTRSMLF